jgi:hypothetical protein
MAEKAAQRWLLEPHRDGSLNQAAIIAGRLSLREVTNAHSPAINMQTGI